MQKESEKAQRAHIVVSGRVQGIGFRYNVQKWAQSLGLKGWVRNLVDGSVEILAEGEENSLRQFIEKIKQGFGQTHVDDCNVSYEIPTGEFFGFEILY